MNVYADQQLSTIEALSQRMASDSYEERLEAHKKLMKLAVQKKQVTADQLFQTYKEMEHPEARERMRGILEILVVRDRYDVGSGFVGIVMADRRVDGVENDVISGVSILEVTPNSPASGAGLQKGDLIIAVNDIQAFAGADATQQFKTYIISKQPGDEAKLTILRAGQKIHVTLFLGRFPKNALNNRRFNPRRARNQNSERDFFNKWLADKLQRSKK